jgi:hypothetical protein
MIRRTRYVTKYVRVGGRLVPIKVKVTTTIR